MSVQSVDNRYFVFDQIERLSTDELAILLDANITKPEFQRHPKDKWYDAIKNRRLCRVPSLPEKFDLLAQRVPQTGRNVLLAEILDACSECARKLTIVSGSVGRDQVDRALQGGLVTFERGSAILLAFNDVALKHTVGLPTENGSRGDAKSEPASELLLGPHSISIACFYFYNLWPAFSAGFGEAGSKQNFISLLADATKLSGDVIDHLVGSEPSSSTQPEIDRAVKYCATYPTMRAIFKALERFPACSRHMVGTRSEWIQRLHVQSGNKRALDEESVSIARMITRPPYDWRAAVSDADTHPTDSPD